MLVYHTSDTSFLRKTKFKGLNGICQGSITDIVTD